MFEPFSSIIRRGSHLDALSQCVIQHLLDEDVSYLKRVKEQLVSIPYQAIG